MRRVSVRELRNQTAEVMRAVRGGELVTLTMSGEPVADIVPHARQVDSMPVEAFVTELHARWSRRQRTTLPSNGAGSSPQRFLPPAREMPENAIFISYAREDLPAVQRLKAAMDAAGLTTWFDLDRLEGGDDYDRKIRANIGRCSFFVPVISATTQRRHEAYFRREWSYAVDRARNIAEGAVFMLPVCIDDTPESEALVPEQFKALHIVRLAGGEPSPEFLSRLQDLFSGKRS